jgi:Putative zinc-finger
MTAEMKCEQVRDLAPEVALDIAAGEERDAVLRHLTRCPACRQLVLELSSLGDELLLELAPVHDPDAGFESRVLDVISDPSTRARRSRLPGRKRWMMGAAAAAAVVVAALGGVSVFVATADDRQLADSYRGTLAEGRGSFFTAAPLQGTDGRVGTVFGYEGSPSWMMVTLQPPWGEEHRFRVQVVTRDGRYVALGNAVLGGTNKAWGGQLPVDLSSVHEIRFVGADERTVFAATFDAEDPWE